MNFRKPNRLKDFDYSKNGYYFITIVTKDRKKILSDIDPKPRKNPKATSNQPVGVDAHIDPLLTKYGRTAEKYINSISGIDKYIIMPNHIHMIVKNEKGTMWASSPTVSQKIKSFKILVTKELGFSVFQRSFYDHIIRDEKDYLRIWEYIDSNPQKWTQDKYFVE